MDLYAILGVGRDATAEEIRHAYRRLGRELHPDVAGPGHEDEFAAVAHAYEVLSDPDGRAWYDAGVEVPDLSAPARPPALRLLRVLRWVRPWEVAANVALLACGPLWLFGAGQGGKVGDAIMLVACYLFVFAGAPWALVLIVRKNHLAATPYERSNRLPCTVVLVVLTAIGLLVSASRIGGSIGHAIVNLAGPVLLIFGVIAVLAVFTPLGIVVGVAARRTAALGAEETQHRSGDVR